MAGDIQAMDALAFGDLFPTAQHQHQTRDISLPSLLGSPSMTFSSSGLSTPQYTASQQYIQPANQIPIIANQQSTATSSRSQSDRSLSHSPSSSSESKVQKRKRNTEAARRYRQRKVDRVTELEQALAAMQAERDDLRLKLARSETEAEVLRGMFKGGEKRRVTES